MPIRVLLAELSPLIRDIVAGAVDGAPDMQLVGVCDDAADVAAAMLLAQPEVVIVPTGAATVARGYAAVPGVRLLEIGDPNLDVYERRLLAHDPSVGAVLGSIRYVAARTR